MEIHWLHLAGIMVAGFASGWVDSIAGGGGLISLPALLATGMPPVIALGTNKVAATFGSSTSALRYGRAGQVQRVAWAMAGIAFLASAIGAASALNLPQKVLEQVIVVALLAVAIVTALRRDFGSVVRPWPHSPQMYGLAAASFALAIGFYDGLIGPGTGTFLAFTFVVVLGSDFLKATGSTKLVNFATNIAAALFFIAFGRVHWMYALLMGPCILLGAYVGSGMALRVGSRFIRPIFIVVALALTVKLVLSR